MLTQNTNCLRSHAGAIKIIQSHNGRMKTSPLGNFDKNPSLSGSDLKKWVMDGFYHPSRYVEVIRQTRDIYNSQYKLTTASTN